MESRWVPFIKRRVSHITPRDRPVSTPKGVAPVGLYALYAALALVMISIVRSGQRALTGALLQVVPE